MSENKARDRFAALIAQFEMPDADAGNENRLSPRLKMLPLAPVTRTFSDRVVAVGDAAGLVKPTTGGGIYYGMLSGAMAAESLDVHLRSNRLDASALASYERAWRRRLGSEIRAGIRFRSVMARLSDESIDALVDLASVNGVVPLLQKTASFNWHRAAAMALLRHTAFRRIVFPHADTT
jgi:flavin-dependent dehydrogenase